MADQPLKLVKVCIIGNTKTGKTSFLLSYFDKSFTVAYIPTYYPAFKNRRIGKCDSHEFNSFVLQVWDTSYSAGFRSINLTYCIKSLGIFLTFSVTDKNSFQDVELFMSYIKNSETKNPFVILIGNKCDLKSQREVTYEEAKKVADEHDIAYLEVSAKTGYNIERAFQIMYETIYRFYNAKNKIKF